MKGKAEAAIPGPDLRGALDMVAESYLRFLHAGPDAATDDDTKAFAAHHAACRAALAHLDQLLKLARAMGRTGPEIDEATAVLGEARSAIARYREEEEDAAEEQG